MTGLVRNLRFGLSLLGRSLGFTSVALLALTLGIGANTAIFGVVYAALLSPLPSPNPDQLVMVWSRVNGHNNTVSAGDLLGLEAPEHGVPGCRRLERRELHSVHRSTPTYLLQGLHRLPGTP
jgi:hypothetical protein